MLHTSGRTLTSSSFVNTGVTSASLRLLGKPFFVIISLLQMSFNTGAQISDKCFVWISVKVPFFVLFKAVVSLSISLTSLLEK